MPGRGGSCPPLRQAPHIATSDGRIFYTERQPLRVVRVAGTEAGLTTATSLMYAGEPLR